MGSFDAQLAGQIQTAQKAMQQQSDAPGSADMLRLMNLPEFRGGWVLAGAALFAAFLLVLSTVGGAFAGLLRMRRRAAV